MAVPVRLGVLYDFPQADGGQFFEDALRLGLADVRATGRLNGDVDLVARHAQGLPGGTAQAVEDAFAELEGEGVLAVAGPSISDNGIVVRDLATDAELPCINYTGGAITRGPWMFHYQVGSLEEEPAILAAHVAERGLAKTALVFDESPVGRQYAEWFDVAAPTVGVEVLGRAAVAPLAEEVGDEVEGLVALGPDVVVYLGLGVAARSTALALRAAGWEQAVVANSALMFGYARKEWRAGWEGWAYLDTVADDNRARLRLAERSAPTAKGPIGLAAFDIGRLLGEALARADDLTRDGVRVGLERVKRLPASSGRDGTTMGFGIWDHAALKGEYLVLRTWKDGRSVEWEPR